MDPNEPIPLDKGTEARDGGQFPFSNEEWRTTGEMMAAGKSATVLSHDIAPGLEPDYTYLKGDMTAAYNVPGNISKTYPDKAGMVRRSFVFLNHHSDRVPATMIVLDKVVSTQSNFKKTWLLHTEDEPEINGNITSARRTDSGRNVMLQTTVLLPERGNQQIQKIGGPGKEFWVDGRNWGTKTYTDIGQCRVELSPGENTLSDNFLNVIQVMDAEPAPKPLPIQKVFSDKNDYVAVTVGNRMVVQNLLLEKGAKSFGWTIGDKGKLYDVLVTDLKKGIWVVKIASATKRVLVISEKGTAYFRSNGGKFELKFLHE